MNSQTRRQLLTELEEIHDKIIIKKKAMAKTRHIARNEQECDSLTDEKKAELEEQHEILEVFHSIEMKALDTKRECIKSMIARDSSDVWDIESK